MVDKSQNKIAKCFTDPLIVVTTEKRLANDDICNYLNFCFVTDLN